MFSQQCVDRKYINSNCLVKDINMCKLLLFVMFVGHRGNIISKERHDGNKKTENDECRKRRDKTVV